MPESASISGETRGKLRTALEGIITDGSEKSLFFSSDDHLAANSTNRLFTLNDPKLSTGVRLYNEARGLNPLEVKRRFEIVDILVDTQQVAQECQYRRMDWDKMVKEKLARIERYADRIGITETTVTIFNRTRKTLAEIEEQNQIERPESTEYDKLRTLVIGKKWQEALAQMEKVRAQEDKAASVHTGKRNAHKDAVEDQTSRTTAVKSKIGKEIGYDRENKTVDDILTRTKDLAKKLDEPADQENNIKSASGLLTARFNELDQKIKRVSSH